MPQQTELDVLKLECLNDLGLVDEAFALSQKILSVPSLSPAIALRTRLHRALIYEVCSNRKSCEKELRLAQRILGQHPSLKPESYTYFLIRKASYHHVFGDRKTAVAITNTAEQFAQKTHDRKNAALLNRLLGFACNNRDKAITYFRKSAELYKNYNNYTGTAAMYNNISKFSVDGKKEKLAEKYVDSAIVLVSKVEAFDVIADSYRIKSGLAERDGRYGEALRNYKLAAEWTDKETQAHRDLKVRELDLMYHSEANSLREKKLESRVMSTRKWNSMLVVCTVSLVFFALVLLYFMRLLSRSRSRINIQKKSISEKNEVLKKNVEEKQFLVHELNHRVKNNLAVILSLVGFQRDETTDPVYRHKFEQLYARISTISLAHHLFSYNADNFSNSSVELREYSKSIIAPHTAGHNAKMYVETVLDDFQLPVDQVLCYGLLLNELLTNSLKHAVPSAEEDLKIRLVMRNNDGMAEMEYSDNGRLFTRYGKTSSLGRFIIDAMVEQLGGKYERKDSHYRISFRISQPQTRDTQ